MEKYGLLHFDFLRCNHILFRHEIKFYSNTYLKDHSLFGSIVISAATLIVEVSKLLCDFFDSVTVTLTDVFFLEPIFLLSPTTFITVSIDKKLKRFEIVRNDGKVSIVGKFSHNDDDATPRVSHDEKAVSSMEKYDFYRELTRFGYEHAGVFQSVHRVFYNEVEGSVELVGDQLDAVFDGLMQAVVLKKLFETPHTHCELTVPFSFKEITVCPEPKIFTMATLKGKKYRKF